MRRPSIWILALALSCAGAVPRAAAQRPPGDTLALALRLFLADSVEASFPLFAAAVWRKPRDAMRRAWLAEAARRTERWDLAASQARIALELRPCLGFAHDVLAGLYNPQYSGWELADADSGWSHALEAVRCDPGEGSAWMTLWIGALSRADTALERRAVSALLRERFITQPYQTHARWVLESAPAHAVLLASGDLDTYPEVAVQVVHGIRTDVVVVNRNLLNLPWYAERISRRSGLPLPDSSRRDSTVTPGEEIMRLWTAEAVAGRLGRPLVIPLTATRPERGRLAGPFWLVDPEGQTGGTDRAGVGDALRRADGLDWRGPALSDRDRSPVRNAYTTHPAYYVGYLAALECDELIRSGDIEGGRRRLAWAESFLARSGIPASVVSRLLGSLREWFERNPR